MFTHVLAPLDTSSLAEQSLPVAASIAKRYKAGLTLFLVHEPMPSAGFPDAPWHGGRMASECAYVDSKAHELAQAFGIEVDAVHRTGPAAARIVNYARDNDVDLIVMTSHGRTGVGREWLGSVTDAVVRSATAPVLILRDNGDVTVQVLALYTVFIPVDGSPAAEHALAPALALGGPSARYVLASIVPPVPLTMDFVDPYTLTAAIPDPDATQRLVVHSTRYVHELATRFAQQGAHTVDEVVMVAERPAPALLELARTQVVDVIALTTSGRGSSRLIVGSVADKLLRGSRTPILVQCTRRLED